MSARVQSLRELLERRFPDAAPPSRHAAGSLATGIAPLDGALPEEGLPRGRLSAWVPGAGTGALLRAACVEAAGRGERAAWLDGADGTGTITGEGWSAGPILGRPRNEAQALEAAEELLRSGGFALIVLSGLRVADAGRVRLSRAVREGGAALATIDENTFLAGLRIRTRILPEACRWRTNALGEPVEAVTVALRARVRAPGWSRRASFSLSVASDELRLSLDPEPGDRRGAAR